MENNYFHYHSNEDILFLSRNQKLTNIHSIKLKFMALNHKKPIVYKKMQSERKNKDYTNIKELLKSKPHSIRNVFNSFFHNSQSQEVQVQQQPKELPLQSSTNHLSINININNINIQNYNENSKKSKLNNAIKFPLVLKHNIMTPLFEKANIHTHKLHLEKKHNKFNSLDSLGNMNILKGKDNDNLVFHSLKKSSKVIDDDNNEDSVIDELVDLLEKGEKTNRTTKEEDETLALLRNNYSKMRNQLRPQTSYGGLKLRQRQLQKSASCRFQIK